MKYQILVEYSQIKTFIIDDQGGDHDVEQHAIEDFLSEGMDSNCCLVISREEIK